MDKKDEVFRPMVYPNVNTSNYKISNYGKVKKLYKNGMKKSSWKIVTPRVDREGYLVVGVAGKDLRLNRVLGFTFIPNDDPENKTVVDHINGDKQYNYCGDEEHNYTNGNLRWLTPGDNTRAAVEQGLTKKAENMSIIGIEVATMKAKLFRSQAAMAQYIGTDPRNVNRIVTNWEKGCVKGWRAIKINDLNDERYKVTQVSGAEKSGISDIGGNWIEIIKDGFHLTIIDESKNVHSHEQLRAAAQEILNKLQ